MFLKSLTAAVCCIVAVHPTKAEEHWTSYRGPTDQGVCGTADLPVAEEAAVTAEELGSKVERLYDVGVAGLHRLLDNNEKLMSACASAVLKRRMTTLPVACVEVVAR